MYFSMTGAAVAADEVLPRVGQRGCGGLDVALHVLGEALVHRRPARVDDVHEHERVVVGQMDVDVVGRVVRTEPCEVDALSADLERQPILEGLLGLRPGRVVVAEQEVARLLMSYPRDVLVKERGRAGVVGVVVGVDEVGDTVADAVGGRDLVDRPLDVAPDRRRRVEQDDPVRRGEERRLVGPVGDPIEIAFHAADVVAPLVERGSERRGWDGSVVGQVRGAHGAGRGLHLGRHVGRAHRMRPVSGARGSRLGPVDVQLSLGEEPAALALDERVAVA